MAIQITREKLEELSRQALNEFSWVPRREAVVQSDEAQKRLPRDLLSKYALDWLADAGKKPFLTTTDRARQLGFPGSKAQKAKHELERFGLIRQHKVPTAKAGGQLVLQEVTEAGYEHLRKRGVQARPPRGIGGWVHKFYQHLVAEWARREYPEGRVAVEDAGSGKSVDVAVYLPSPRGTLVGIAFEIFVSGEAKEVGNVTKDLEAGFSKVVLCADAQERLESLRGRVLRELGPGVAGSVEFRLVSEFLGRVKESIRDDVKEGEGDEEEAIEKIERMEGEEKTVRPLESVHGAESDQPKPNAQHKPGGKPKTPLTTQIEEAYAHLHNLDWLQESPLTSLSEVRRRVQPIRTMPEAQALRDLLVECAVQVTKDLNGLAHEQGTRKFLERYLDGKRVADIARELGVSREWCSRTYRREALRLVSRQFAKFVTSDP